jgi:MFS transporter, NNP family, nitrate/nitrite transporter
MRTNFRIGGVIFAIIFRYTLTPKDAMNFPKVFWIIGVMTIAINVAVCWIRPIPMGQIGGH